MASYCMRASIAGILMPERYSMQAPPPVEMCVKFVSL